jgi:hypothetical protein
MQCTLQLDSSLSLISIIELATLGRRLIRLIRVSNKMYFCPWFFASLVGRRWRRFLRIGCCLVAGVLFPCSINFGEFQEFSYEFMGKIT